MKAQESYRKAVYYTIDPYRWVLSIAAFGRLQPEADLANPGIRTARQVEQVAASVVMDVEQQCWYYGLEILESK